jgi:hypothetical protein
MHSTDAVLLRIFAAFFFWRNATVTLSFFFLPAFPTYVLPVYKQYPLTLSQITHTHTRNAHTHTVTSCGIFNLLWPWLQELVLFGDGAIYVSAYYYMCAY